MVELDIEHNIHHFRCSTQQCKIELWSRTDTDDNSIKIAIVQFTDCFSVCSKFWQWVRNTSYRFQTTEILGLTLDVPGWLSPALVGKLLILHSWQGHRYLCSASFHAPIAAAWAMQEASPHRMPLQQHLAHYCKNKWTWVSFIVNMQHCTKMNRWAGRSCHLPWTKPVVTKPIGNRNASRAASSLGNWRLPMLGSNQEK